MAQIQKVMPLANLMFEDDKGKKYPTKNPLTGCDIHNCVYCYARYQICNGRLKTSDKYKDCKFKPTFHPEVLGQSWGKNTKWFISSLGDLWAKDILPSHQKAIVDDCRKADKSNTILFSTKDPGGYVHYILDHNEPFAENMVLGVTIESNRIYHDVSNAPPPSERVEMMCHDVLHGFRKQVTFEPILDFDHEVMVKWVELIQPEIVFIGYDNHPDYHPNVKLCEPSLEKTERLIKALEKITKVGRKTLREALK